MTRYWGQGHISDSISGGGTQRLDIGGEGHISDSILGRRGTLVTRYWGEGHISDSILRGGAH